MDLSSLEALGVAIRSEMEASEIYGRLADRVRNVVVKKKLRFLSLAEEKHQIVLTELYEGNFPEVNLVLPENSILPKIDLAVDDRTPPVDLLQIAMEWEKLSEDFYTDLADGSKDLRGREMLRYLGQMERNHYRMLEVERDLLARFPNYFDVDEFHLGNEMIHLGP